MAAGGCAAVAPVDLLSAGSTNASAKPAGYDDRPWEDVLRGVVRDGRVDYALLALDPVRLEEFLGEVKDVGPHKMPQVFPDADARLAYYINVYNACVLRAVLAAGVPTSMHGARPLETGYRFGVDGGMLTLADLHERVRRESGDDPRSELVLCDAAMGSPPLPDQPFRSYNIREHLRQAARQALDSPAVVTIDHEGRAVLLGEALWRNRERFTQLYEREMHTDGATTLNWLMHLAGPNRRSVLAGGVGYPTREMPFDRALNVWTRATE